MQGCQFFVIFKTWASPMPFDDTLSGLFSLSICLKCNNFNYERLLFLEKVAIAGCLYDNIHRHHIYIVTFIVNYETKPRTIHSTPLGLVIPLFYWPRVETRSYSYLAPLGLFPHKTTQTHHTAHTAHTNKIQLTNRPTD